MKKLIRAIVDSQAAEIAEFAVVLPLLLSIIFGIFSFSRAYNIYNTITRAAQEGARVAGTPACVSCGGLACGAGPSTQFACDAVVVSAITSVLQASHIDPAQIMTMAPATPTAASWTAQSCPPPAPAPACNITSPGNVTICRFVVLNPASTTQECGTVVSFQYPYQFLPMLTVKSINIPAQAQTRMEY